MGPKAPQVAVTFADITMVVNIINPHKSWDIGTHTMTIAPMAAQ